MKTSSTLPALSLSFTRLIRGFLSLNTHEPFRSAGGCHPPLQDPLIRSIRVIRGFPSFRIACLASILLASCSSLPWQSAPEPALPTPQGLPAALPLPSLPETLINFIVEVPANTPPGQAIYLTILDEITGLSLNAQANPMDEVPIEGSIAGQSPRIFVVTLPAAIGSLIHYRYERQAGSIRAAEHLPDGEPVHYRLLRIDGPGVVRDVVSRWTDTPYTGQVGRISGQAVDAANGRPIPGLLVTAAGAQTFTAADGAFALEDLPPGVHTLTAISIDGKYQSFQQGARVAPDDDTLAQFSLTATTQVKVVFLVSVPVGTPPGVPLRLAGSLLQLGNTFASLTGGLSILASRAPAMNQLPDGRYMLTLDLPAGADIRYKYTLGDGFWNAEHRAEGGFRLRQAVIPPYNVIIEDRVETWFAGPDNSITFDLTVPADTPAGDFISIQFNPLFGWTEPIPMWRLGGNRWGYILYSPLNLPGNLSYRYCRNDQCGAADDAQTPGAFGKGRPLQITNQPQVLQDQVAGWLGLPAPLGASSFSTPAVQPRGADFWAGVELSADYHPSWQPRLPAALQAVKDLGANWLVLTPTWSYPRQGEDAWLPRFNLQPAQDMLWSDLLQTTQSAQVLGLSVALYPTPRFPGDPAGWWSEARRDAAWWETWFAGYRRFALHHADLAQRSGAAALILGGEHVQPALTGGALPDGSPSGVPADAAQQWSALLGEVRSRYTGALLWALPLDLSAAPPDFLDRVDMIYLTWTVGADEQLAAANGQRDLQAGLDGLLDGLAAPLQSNLGKPFILALSAPADAPHAQAHSYLIALQAAAQRPWIDGFVSQGYYPPAALLTGFSIHGAPAGELLKLWFPLLIGQ